MASLCLEDIIRTMYISAFFIKKVESFLGRARCHALPSEACCEKMQHFCELLLLLNGV